MIAIRAMAADDLDRVLKLEGSTPEAPHWNRAAYERFLLGPGAKEVDYVAWIAEDGSCLEGFATARRVLDVCELESMVVAEKARRRGIGKALLKAIADWGVTQGAMRMELEVRVSNKNAIRFYERLGLSNEGVRRGYYREPEEDAVLMGKGLNSAH